MEYERKTKGVKGWKRKKNDRMKERKGPKSYWQETAAPDLSESRQQVGRLSRLGSTAAWAALSQQLIKEAFYLVPALNERLRDHEGHVIQRCGEKAKFQDHLFSIFGASRETQRYQQLSDAPPFPAPSPTPLHTSTEGEMKGFFCFLFCCVFFL